MKTVSIQSIEFYAGSPELTLRSLIVQNNLTYDSLIRLKSSVFNKLLNILQKLNPDLDIYSFLNVEDHPNGDIFYKLYTDQIQNTMSFEIIEENKEYKLIRA